MNGHKIGRRMFLRNSTLAATGMALAGTKVFPVPPQEVKNRLPRWKGFNLLDLFSPNPPRNPDSNRTTEEDLKWRLKKGEIVVSLPNLMPTPLRHQHAFAFRISNVAE